jgi:hypothetical protein
MKSVCCRGDDCSIQVLLYYLPPTIHPSAAEEQLRSLSSLLGKAHKAANAAQTSYHNAVVRSAGCLALAFSALAFGTFPPEFWPLKAPLDWPSFELVLSWLEAIALLFMLLLFLHGHMTRRPWIVGRVGTELLRQYQILSIVFPARFARDSPLEGDGFEPSVPRQFFWPPVDPRAIHLPQYKPAPSRQGPMVQIHLPPPANLLRT